MPDSQRAGWQDTPQIFSNVNSAFTRLSLIVWFTMPQGDSMSPEKLTGGRRAARRASDVRRQGRQGHASLVQIADFDVGSIPASVG